MTSTEKNQSRTGSASALDSAEAGELRTTLLSLVDDLLLHDGFGHLEIDMKILKRGQKEVLISCGKEHRFVIDYSNPSTGDRHRR